MIKELNYEFHYDYIENKYGNNSRILLTNTDSFMYEIKTEYVYENSNNDYSANSMWLSKQINY